MAYWMNLFSLTQAQATAFAKEDGAVLFANALRF
jgi:hypothetical protein